MKISHLSLAVPAAPMILGGCYKGAVMKNIISLITAFIISLGLCHAQGTEEIIYKDPYKSAGVYYVYDYKSNPVLTPAPDGYRPVYISHFGRHGARYCRGEYDSMHAWLTKADKAGALTPDGMEYLKRFMIFYDKVNDREGNLTAIGRDQHRTIASRIFSRFPEVFEGTTKVEAVSTEPSRCIMSMWSFLSTLQNLDASLELSADASACYASWLQPLAANNPHVIAGRPRYNKKTTEDIKEYFYDTVEWKNILGRFFISPETVQKKLRIDPREFINAVYFIDADTQCLDHDKDYFDGVFSLEEKYAIWKAYVASTFALLANYEGADNLTVDYSAYTLEQIIKMADSDIGSGKTQLRLRFGHDSGIMPLLAFMNINGFGRSTSSFDEAAEIFPTYEIPMGCSVQLIFYRNEKGHTLVQILLNEKEASIPVKPAMEGYYDWDEFKAHYIPLIKASKDKIEAERKRFMEEKSMASDIGKMKAIDWGWKNLNGTSIETGHASLDLFGGRQSIYLARCPLGDQHFSIVSANGAKAGPTSRIAAENNALVAMNGSYFNMKKHFNVTLVKDEGRIIPSSTVGDQKHSNGILRLQGRKGNKVDIFRITDTLECMKEVKRWREAIISGPVLLDSGKRISYAAEGSPEDADVMINARFYKRFYAGRHPRTAVGYTQDGWLYFIVVDGRFPGKADGMSMTELQALAEALGLYEAMNLDGGGSSTLWTSTDGVLNHPCDNKTFDNKGERIVPNILIVK